MKAAIFIGIILIALCYGSTGYGSGGLMIGNYSLPLVETGILLTRWLQQEKYSVSSESSPEGEIVLKGASSGKLIRVLIRPHSSLATNVELLEPSDMKEVTAIRGSWESFLEKSGQSGGIAIPERIRSLADAVVCISSPSANVKKLNFTGFLIDRTGTILTIAHDFDELRNFNLFFPGGEVSAGRVVKSDVEKDLSLIASDLRGYAKYFALNEGRLKINIGDRIFMLCCSSTGSIQIQSGTVDKPKASVSGQTLWQVKLQQIFSGSSGSPVVDESGRLVGVVKGRYRGTETRGFLIPVSTMRSFAGTGNL